MERVQFSAILNSADKSSCVSFMIDITNDVSFGVCSDSIVFTSNSKEITDYYARFVLTHYRILGGEPVMVCKRDTRIEEFGIYQITITVK